MVDNICKLAKKGATPSQIGVVLRDSHGVAQVKVVTGMFFCISLDVDWRGRFGEDEGLTLMGRKQNSKDFEE